MDKTIFCIKHQKKLLAMTTAPVSGEEGYYLLRHVSQQAWQEWLVEQTKLINENKLSMLDASTRRFLREQRGNFLHNRPFSTYDPELI